jgi:signal transduction histidine kinase
MFKRVPNQSQPVKKSWSRRILSRLSISHKISFGYGLTLGIAVLGTTAGFVVGDYYQQQARLQENDAQREIRTLQHLQTMLLHARAHQQNFLSSAHQPEQFREDYHHFLEHVAEFNQAWSAFNNYYENPKNFKVRSISDELATFRRLMLTNNTFIEVYFEQTAELLKRINSPNLKSEEIEKLRTQLANLSNSTVENKVENTIDALTDLIHASDKKYEQARVARTVADAIRLRIIAISILVSVALAIVFAIYTIRAITSPILATTKVAQQVTQDKNFNLQAPVTTEDEIGALTTSLNQLILRVNQLLEEQKAANYTQLIHQEKMSSLGRMLAGVAHEINDPVNFISGNSVYASEYVKGLLALIETYTTEIPNPPRTVEIKREEIDFDFVKQDLPKLLKSMKSGAERTAQIILSLKHFSRLDEAIAHPVDLHACIDSTLLILNSRINREIAVMRNYGDIPEIKGYAGLLYQVFMNLLSNAIDGLEQARNDKQITITTELQNEDCVVVKIADNGTGISPENQAKIFDAFFTTKPTDLATGLGLAISHQIIVEKHGGKITCKSEVGVGTEFAIALPIKQQSSGDWEQGRGVLRHASRDWELESENLVPMESHPKELSV